MKKKHTKKRCKDRTEQGGGSYSERVGHKWFCCAFKLSFLQLMCKASLIFKSNLELALNYFKKNRIIQVKGCYAGVQMF